MIRIAAWWFILLLVYCGVAVVVVHGWSRLPCTATSTTRCVEDDSHDYSSSGAGGIRCKLHNRPQHVVGISSIAAFHSTKTCITRGTRRRRETASATKHLQSHNNYGHDGYNRAAYLVRSRRPDRARSELCSHWNMDDDDDDDATVSKGSTTTGGGPRDRLQRQRPTKNASLSMMTTTTTSRVPKSVPTTERRAARRTDQSSNHLSTLDDTAQLRQLGRVGAKEAILDYCLSKAQQCPNVELFKTALTLLSHRRTAAASSRDVIHRLQSRQPQRVVVADNDSATWYQQACCLILDEMDRHTIAPSADFLVVLFQVYCFSHVDVTNLRAMVLDRYPTTTWTEAVWESAILCTCTSVVELNSSSPPPQRPTTTKQGSPTTTHCSIDGVWTTAYQLYQDLLLDLHRRSSSPNDTESIGLQKPNSAPSERIYMALFQVCAIVKNMDGAMLLLDSILSLRKTEHRSDEALSRRRFGTQDGCRVSPRIWAALLKVCNAVHDPQQSYEILRRMNQLRQQPNVRHCTAHLKTLIEAQALNDAIQFLDEMLMQNETTTKSKEYHITSTTRSKPLETTADGATSVYPLRLTAPDMVALKTVVNGCAGMSNYTLARQLLDRIKSGYYGETVQTQLDVQCYHAVLTACTDPVIAKEIIREMRLTRRYRIGVVPPNHVTYTKAISVCRKAKDVTMARFFLSSARNDGIVADAYMYSAAIWTAAQALDSDAALEFFHEMRTNNCTSIVSYNGVLATLAAAGDAQQAFNIYREMKRQDQRIVTPDFATYMHLTAAIRSASGEEEQLALFWRVYALMSPEERRVEIGGCLLEALILSYGLLGHFDEAMYVFESIKGPSNAERLRAILFACSYADPPEWKTALSLLHSSDIVEGGAGPAFVEPGALCNAMLACSKADKWEESLQLFRLYGDRATPIAAVNSLIASCGRGGRADMAIELLDEMVGKGLKPDTRSYRNAIIACNQAEHVYRRSLLRSEKSGTTNRAVEWWERAYWLLGRMKKSGLRPDTPALSSAISACEAAGKWQLALEILQTAIDNIDDKEGTNSENKLNLYCFNAALAACEKGGAWVEALEIYEKMKAAGVPQLRPNIVTLNSVIVALDGAGQKELAVSIYEEGIRMNYLKNPWRSTTGLSASEPIDAMDLHSFSGAMARAAIRAHMESLVLLPGVDSPLLANDLIIIVGKGLRSEDQPVLKYAVYNLLEADYGITAFVDEQNVGRLVVPSESLRTFVEERNWH